VNLFGRTFRYEQRAEKAIQEAKKRWSNIESVVESLEWGIMHDTSVGTLLNERGLRGFTFPGARSLNEPDIDVLYVPSEFLIIIENLTFMDAKAHHAGTA
jgi:hypothetical protein